MRYLTMRELNEQHGGILPPDACLRADDDEIAARPARTAARPAPAAKPTRKPPSPRRDPRGPGKPNPVVRKVKGYRQFFAVLPTLEPTLSPGAVALWAWLWTCERDGRARCSERRLAGRFGMVRDTVRRRLAELEDAGLIRRVRRGRHGRSATVYRVRPTPKRPTE